MKQPRKPARKLAPLGAALAALLLCAVAHADTSVELSGAAIFGAHGAGASPPRFTLSPSASLSVRGDGWFLVARDAVSFLGAGGGRFGVDNETTLGAGLFWESVNVSVGPSLSAYTLPLCGARLCGQVRGVAPGVGLRVDVFGPYLEGALGVSIDCALTFITGAANASIWSGVSGRCAAGPVVRFASRP